MWIRSQGTFEEYRKIRQGYEIDNRKIFGEYAEDVIGVKERAGVKHNTIYEKLHKEKEMIEAKMLLPSLFEVCKEETIHLDKLQCSKIICHTGHGIRATPHNKALLL